MHSFSVTYTAGSPVCEITFSKALPGLENLTHPHVIAANDQKLDEIAAQIRAKIAGFDELDHYFQLLTSDVISLIHMRNVFAIPQLPVIPVGMADASADPTWFQVANSISGMCTAIDLRMISYSCENSGNLFVHLAPRAGTEEDAIKSRKDLRGHTDGTIFPLGRSHMHDAELPPGPDFVILGCLNNPGSTPTRIAPLSAIIRKLTSRDLTELQESSYQFSPQSSFDLLNVTRTHQPVLFKSEDEGFLIRYSHSKVKPMATSDTQKRQALDNLASAISSSLQNIVLNAGDAAFINNRTAIHGRGLVELTDVSNRRWLLRTYAQKQVNESFCVDPTRPFELHRL